MNEKFEKVMDVLDELDWIKDKAAFIGEVALAFGARENELSISKNALCGLFRVNQDIENQFEAISKALQEDFHVIKKSDKEARLDKFCETVEAGIKTGVAGT
jgi:hypothetical protein